MKEVKVYDNEPRVGTFLLAQGLRRRHQDVTSLINKYREKFEILSCLKQAKLKSTGGRAATEYLLDEDQFMFLGTLLKNSETVIEFKFRIIKEFKKCRKQLAALQHHKSQPQYQVSRDASILIRKEATATMKQFIEYAKEQGSSNADKYYISISAMLNKMLFIVEGHHRNIRNMLSVRQLMTISSAEQIVDKGLSYGMAHKRYYKDIYQDIKAKVQLFADMHGQSEVMAKQLELL